MFVLLAVALLSRIPARFPNRAEAAWSAALGSPADGSTTSATPSIENYLELIANAIQLHNQRVRRLSASRPRLMLARTSSYCAIEKPAWPNAWISDEWIA